MVTSIQYFKIIVSKITLKYIWNIKSSLVSIFELRETLHTAYLYSSIRDVKKLNCNGSLVTVFVDVLNFYHFRHFKKHSDGKAEIFYLLKCGNNFFFQ